MGHSGANCKTGRPAEKHRQKHTNSGGFLEHYPTDSVIMSFNETLEND